MVVGLEWLEGAGLGQVGRKTAQGQGSTLVKGATVAVVAAGVAVVFGVRALREWGLAATAKGEAGVQAAGPVAGARGALVEAGMTAGQGPPASAKKMSTEMALA